MNQNHHDHRWKQCYWPEWSLIKERWNEIRETRGQHMDELPEDEHEPGVRDVSRASRVEYPAF